jgi:hypothetical protein
VTTTAGPADRRSVAFPGGAALVGDDGTWVLADADPVRSLGPALAVAWKAGSLQRLHVVVEDHPGLLARQASQFAFPPTVWRVAGTALERAEPDPVKPAPPLDPRIRPFIDTLLAAGADPVVEHGRLVGEVHGLEVARVVVDDAGPHLEIGVGRFDREANELLGRQDSLPDIVALVRRHRTLDADSHPLKLLAASRWLRSRLLAAPGAVGADHLAPVAPTVEPPDLRTAWPAPAAGLDLDGRPIVVVCSVGVDLDLVPAAADVRLVDGRDARLVLVVPAQDRHPVTLALAAALSQPAEVLSPALAG